MMVIIYSYRIVLPDPKFLSDSSAVKSFSFYNYRSCSAPSVIPVGNSIVSVLLELVMSEFHGNGRLFCMAVILVGSLRELHASAFDPPGGFLPGGRFGRRGLYHYIKTCSGITAGLRHPAVRCRKSDISHRYQKDENLYQKDKDKYSCLQTCQNGNFPSPCPVTSMTDVEEFLHNIHLPIPET